MRRTTRLSLLTSLSGIALAMPSQAMAQDDPAVAADEPTIIVTGTRSTSRTVEDSPVPVDVITGDAISNGG